MKKRIIILIAGGLLLLALVVAVPFLVQRSVQSRIGPPHTFVIAQPPRFLTEELALAKAKDTLSADGYDVAAWQPMREGAPPHRTDAPTSSWRAMVSRRIEASSCSPAPPHPLGWFPSISTAAEWFARLQLPNDHAA
jgi:hypothetical protein